MYFESENRSWFRAAGLFAVLALAAVFVLDEPLARVARGGVSGDLRRPLEWSEGYAHGLGVILISLCIAWLDERRRQFVPRLLIVVWAVGLAANLVKALVERHRPYDCARLELTARESFTGFLGPWDAPLQSFPSGHTATAVALTIVLSRLYPAGRPLFVALCLLAAAQRVFSQAHFFSDTLAAAALACLVAGPLAARLLWDAVEAPEATKP